jgi:membrane-associated phospholipid phosphatase
VSEAPASPIDGARRARFLLTAAAIALLLLAVVYGIAVRTTWGQRQDVDAVLGRYVSERAHDEVARLLATISVASLGAIGGGIVVLALVRRRPHLALAAGVVIVGAVATTELLKRVLPRPDLLGTSWSGSGSFPSGHATGALTLALALAIVVPRSLRNIVALGGLAYALAIGIGVVSAGAHRPSDVLGAYLVTFAWTAAACAVLVDRYGTGGEREPAHARTGRPRPLSLGALLTGSGIVLLALAGLAATAIVLERRHGEFERLGVGYEYALACLTIAAVGVALAGLLLWLLRGVSLDSPRERPSRAGLPVDV